MKFALLISKGVLAVCFSVLTLLLLILNHADRLNLDEVKLNYPVLMQHYNVAHLKSDTGFLVANQVISGMQQQLFVDDQPIVTIHRPLVGAIEMDYIFIVATDDSLILINKDRTELLEQLGHGKGIPGQIQNIGLHYNAPILQTRSGMWRGNFMLDKWELVTLDGVSWSQAEPLPANTQVALANYFIGDGLPVKTLLTDLFSGRVFGSYGIWLIDLVLLFTLVFIICGIFGISGKRL